MNKLLISLMVLFLVVTSAFARSTMSGRVNSDFLNISAALELFRADVGRYPSTDEGLHALLPNSLVKNTVADGYIRNVGKDPWSNPYQYRFPGYHNEAGFDLWSFGAYGMPGGAGFDSDIGNWVGGFSSHNDAAAFHEKEKLLSALPVLIPVGLFLAGGIYFGLSIIRVEDGMSRRQAFAGLPIFISLLFLVFYLFMVVPYVMY